MNKKYKLIAMDLDGTLTQHKSKLETENKNVLDDLKKFYKVLIVGAGSCERIYNQMNRYEIDIIGNYGMQYSKIVNGNFTLIRNDVYSVDKDFFEKTVTDLRALTGFTEYCGENVEFHHSGAVTFPLIGTKADLSDKLLFDPDGKKREAIYQLVCSKFEDYNCFIGGTSSFDIVKKKHDKYKAILNYLADTKISVDEVLYIGDDFKRGGNDEQVMKSGMDCLEIKNYCDLRQLLKTRGII